TSPFAYPGWFTSRDELDWGFETRQKGYQGGAIASGLQNTNNPYLNYWSGTNGGKALYAGIRNCNIFLENIHIPKDVSPEERTRWIAEVKFLKAYYHFFLMQLYGPIVLIKDNLPLSATPEEVKAYREPVNECVDYIVKLLDEAIPDLPAVLPDPLSEQGRITQIIALAVKAKVLVWGASPLFNGNTDYSGWIDKRGKQLIPSTYDNSKWEKAAAALKEAIDLCESNGLSLYKFNKFSGGPQTFKMNDTLVTEMTIRKAVTEDVERNTGVIWASQEQFSDYKGAIPGGGNLGNLIKELCAELYTTDQPSYMGYYHASWHMSDLFYSNNGVPIAEDKDYNYAGRFDLHPANAPAYKHLSYIANGETTINLHYNREPRFYADLGFDRSFYELATCTKDGGATFSPFLKLRIGEINDKRMGYMVKKIVPFETSASQGDANKYYTAYDYRFPLIRLADLYLLYSEALNEMKDQPDAEVYQWIDRVRSQAGLKGVVESWSNYSKIPAKPTTKDGMREIIRKERMIELAFEAQRWWDVRRWKIADQYWTLVPTKWNNSKDLSLTYKAVEYEDGIKVTFRDFLFPLTDMDLRINSNLTQTYGW
ncbi:MAG: RagB/SusD family nutrient uptake outer membrane protein, partial [Bacteroidota bacterium]|nr:RagB/SusD family nutrient uptake outer membrane protein [Bacteroidota bacterium]